MPILDLGEVRGPQGPAGVSPTVQVDKTSSGTKVTITGAGGAQSFEVTDGDTIAVGSNLNLLINHDFMDPINQRGEKVYGANRYSIDMWRTSSDMELTVEDDCISMRSPNLNATWPGILQYFEDVDKYIGKTVTFSILCIGSSSDVSCVISLRNQNGAIRTGEYFRSATWDLVSYTCTIPDDSTTLLASIMFNNPKNTEFRLRVRAAKVELGTVQTLAHKEGDEWVLNDPPPNKALELAKCQRYQIVFRPENYTSFLIVGTGIGIGASYASCFVSLPVPLRGNYTISFSGDWVFDKGSTTSNTIAVTKMTSYNYRAKNGVSIVVSGESVLEADKSYRLIGLNTPETNLLLDANL